MKLLYAFLLMALPDFLSAQQMERHVLSTAGNVNQNGSISLEWTLGEIAVEQLTNSTSILAQGFHQISNTDRLNSLTTVFVETWPNPVSGELNIRISELLPGLKFTLYDINGKELKLFTIDNSNHLVVNMTEYVNGVYYLSLKDESGSIFQNTKICKIN